MRKARREEVEEERDRETDVLVSCTVEAVETVVSSLFYDRWVLSCYFIGILTRLFSQPTSDDASHDEILSSRAAALNMLDLTLQHLDIDVGEAGDDVGVVVRACGDREWMYVCRSGFSELTGDSIDATGGLPHAKG